MAFEFNSNITLSPQYLADQFTKFLPGFYQPDIGEFWGLDRTRNLHKATPDLPLGLENIKGFAKQYIGEVAEFNGNAQDIPTVDVQIGEFSGIKAKIYINAATWTKFELIRQSNAQQIGAYMPSMDIVKERVDAMGEFHNRNDHMVTLFGGGFLKSIPGFRGIYNQDNVIAKDITQDWYDTTNVTPQQIYNSLIDEIYEFIADNFVTNLSRIELLIPTPLMKRMSESINSNYESVSLFKKLTDSTQGYYVGKITDAFENEGAYLNLHIRKGATAYPTNRDRIIIKLAGTQNANSSSILATDNARSETLQRHFFPRVMETTFTPDGGLTFKRFAFSATTGVYALRPNRVKYLDINNASK